MKTATQGSKGTDMPRGGKRVGAGRKGIAHTLKEFGHSDGPMMAVTVRLPDSVRQHIADTFRKATDDMGEHTVALAYINSLIIADLRNHGKGTEDVDAQDSEGTG